ncbi:hypothetical protein [Hyphomonas sp.]|uniref:hypothetical protein n=1 Tax=Hyphomonas sp. TaxID=87 RepID=UPI0025C54D92|nr:hypothetical protein [Hyphomonas sp.]
MSPRSAASYFAVIGTALLIVLLGYAVALLDDPVPEIRAGALGALATLTTGIIAIGAAATVWIIAQRQREDAATEQSAAEAAGAIAVSEYALLVLARCATLSRDNAMLLREDFRILPDKVRDEISSRAPGDILYPYLVLRSRIARFDARTRPAPVTWGQPTVEAHLVRFERSEVTEIAKDAFAVIAKTREYGGADPADTDFTT